MYSTHLYLVFVTHVLNLVPYYMYLGTGVVQLYVRVLNLVRIQTYLQGRSLTLPRFFYSHQKQIEKNYQYRI